jgi:hypothetical protein
MSQRDRIDPPSREPLEQLLQALPGGFNAVPNISARREAVSSLTQLPRFFDHNPLLMRTSGSR